MFIDFRIPQTPDKPRRGVTPVAWLRAAPPGLRIVVRDDVCYKHGAPPELTAGATSPTTELRHARPNACDSGNEQTHNRGIHCNKSGLVFLPGSILIIGNAEHRGLGN